jgi:tetratricopeptide (TPR) repeat protein
VRTMLAIGSGWMDVRALALGFLLALVPVPAAAETAREILTTAAFSPSDKATALARIDRAIKSTDAVLAHDPDDREASLQRALAISYRGKLNRNRSDILVARRGFEAAIASDPRNAEAHMALAGWHLGAIIELGPFMARTLLGARKETGLQALDRSLALGGDRAFFPALASMHRIQLDPSNVAGARRLAEAAVKARAETPLDRLMQKEAATLLESLRKGDGKAAAQTAKLLLPFGRLR